MKRLSAFLFLLALAFAVSAGQLCTIDPPRPGPSTGFYVVGSKLFDPTGEEFRIRGVNQVHWDSWGSAKGIPLSGANTVRLALDFRKTQAANWAVVDPYVAAGLVPIIGNWMGTCKSDPAVLTAIVDTWVAQADTWTKYNGRGLINLANEFGPGNSTVWRDAYVAAIPRMRAAGYTGTLVIDSGGCGQDAQDIIKYGDAVLAADPLKNVLFDVHVYGSFHWPQATATWMQDYGTAMAGLKATGLPLFLGEFGPGSYVKKGAAGVDGVQAPDTVVMVGPSPTMLPPEVLVALAETNGWGWAAWGWDDNSLPNCMSNDVGWFAMTINCGKYTGAPADLTLFGRQIVPLLKALAKPAHF